MTLPADAVGGGGGRWAWAEIDLAAIAHNVGAVRSAAGRSAVWAVVKAGGYGHGAVRVAEAALGAGAVGLCVALVQEGAELRRAGITAPILVLSQHPDDEAPGLVAHDLVPTIYEADRLAPLAEAVRASGRSSYPVHVKVNTGMHRVGVSPEGLAALVTAVGARPELTLDGVFTHLACADEPDRPETRRQLERFDEALAGLPVRPRLVHAANSAGALAHPAACRDLVRAGIALYGIEPGPGVADRCADLRPALSLRARVSFVKCVDAGAAASYGGRWVASARTVVATVPLGYADGVPRRLWECGGEVLVGGRRRSLAGVVTMDQLLVDCGAPGEAGAVAVGDEVVLIGRQGAEQVRAEEWAERLGTIPYEIVCGISSRIGRRYADRRGPDGEPPSVEGLSISA